MRKKIQTWTNEFLTLNVTVCLKIFAYTSRKLNIIQVGANDGQTIDNMYSLITQKKSTSIVVEPVPHVFEKLKKNYSGYSNVDPMQLAITDREDETTKTFYYLKPKTGEPYQDIYTLWGSFSLAHLKKFKAGIPNYEQLLVAEEIPCLSINRLIKLSRFKPIHILATDTEGYDGKIIDSLDLSAHRPELIFFEHIHIPKPELFSLLANLKKQGYRCYSHGFDTICFEKKVMLADLPLRVIRTIFPRILTPRKN